MLKKSTKIKILLFIVFFLLSNILITPIHIASSASVDRDPLLDWEKEIDKTRGKIKELENQKSNYQNLINEKQKQALNLENQIKLLEEQIAKAKINIEITQAKIKEINLEIKKVEQEITDTEKRIATHKERIAEFIRIINKNDNQGYLETILTENNISNFFNQLQYLEKLENDLQLSLDDIQNLKQKLVLEKSNLNAKKEKLKILETQLTDEKNRLQEQQATKNIILTETKNSERKFQQLLSQARLEHEQANVDIKNLEERIRKELERRKEWGEKTAGDTATLSWPVPSKEIVAYFHDPDYPYRKWIGEHSAIDIRTLKDGGVPSNGIPVRAAASGYVARTKDGGATGYSYIMLIHNNGISTVYGHISQILVQEDTYVARGQVIGLSGGMPGTPGAGRFSTGPHLHFEVRLNGLPVNPLRYLP